MKDSTKKRLKDGVFYAFTGALGSRYREKQREKQEQEQDN